MKSLTSYKVACVECFSVSRVESISFELVSRPSRCPYCGSDTARVSRDSLNDYWLELAKSLGLPYNKEGASIAQDIFDSWDREEHSTFKEYVHALRTTG